MLGLYLKLFAGLSRAAGFGWPFLLIASCLRGRSLFRNTRWDDDGTVGKNYLAEKKYVRRLAMAAGMYQILSEKKGQKRAFDLMRSVLVTIGRITVRKRFHSVDLTGLQGMERLNTFNDYMTKQDEAKYNRREYLVNDDTTCHYIINRCVVYDFFMETGTPELTKLICEVDQHFFPIAFYEFSFSRGDSWENTIAYGKTACDFILSLKTVPHLNDSTHADN